jgi:hypothetical protein
LFTSENEILTSIIIGLEDNYTITWNPVFHRLRCNGHIINLSAQSFLFPDLAAVDEEAILKTFLVSFSHQRTSQKRRCERGVERDLSERSTISWSTFSVARNEQRPLKLS